MSSATASSKHYIPAIDGLRAVAVTLVLLFHVDLTWATGGFIGVDVFFVISGFLITGILYNRGEDFTFSDFYKRRFRRLIPALIATLLVSLVAAIFILDTFALKAAGREALYAALSASNILFWLESGYFDSDAKSKLFLHTWSLAVEEQFYLIWPLLIVAASRLRKAGVIIAMLVLGLASFTGAFLLARDNPGAVFFLTPFRVFQFALGGLAAMVALRLPGLIGAGGALIGLIGLGWLTYSLDGASSGVVDGMLAPALLATLVLISARAAPVAATLGNGLLTWVGKRSYSIYLAHWPLIVLAREPLGGQFEPAEAVGLLTASVLLGTLLHWSVEQRFRLPLPKYGAGPIYFGTTLGLIATLFVGAHLWATSTPRAGLNQTLASGLAPITSPEDLSEGRKVLLRTGKCHMTPNRGIQRWDEATCVETAKGRPQWIVAGDSYGADTYLTLSRAVPEVAFTQATMRGCLPVLSSQQPERTQTGCLAYEALWLDQLAKTERYGGVILAARWQADDFERVRATVEELDRLGIEVRVVAPRVRFIDDPSKSVFLDASLMSYTPGDFRGFTRTLMEQFQEAFPERMIDFLPAQCEGNLCPVRHPLSGVPLYADGNHFSVAGMDYFGARLRDQALLALSQP